jgi:hypothetical protein
VLRGLIREALEQWVAQCEAERELEAKIVRFPKQLRRTARRFELTSRRDEK